MSTFGGICRFKLAEQPIVLRTHIKTKPTGYATEALANQNGSICRTLKPTPAEMEVTFQDPYDGETATVATALQWKTIVLQRATTITVTEDDTGHVHTFNNAMIVGEAAVDRSTGEVSGLKVACAGYDYTCQ